MGKNKSITKNAVLNGIKTLLSIVFPLITYPYVTRVLHSTNLGKVNFAQSIVSYFALIAALGVNTYAVREGAKKKESRNDKTKYYYESGEEIVVNDGRTFIELQTTKKNLTIK
jgi:O-antigen/teichoic acid export membrane protein